MPRNKEILDRLLAMVQPVPWSGCWLWTGASYGKGYAGIKVRGKSLYAHRVSYELHKGAIPQGYEVDHLCWVPFCVNPDHLEAVTPEEHHQRNVRSPSFSGLVAARKAKAAALTHCLHGHPYDEANTSWRLKHGRYWARCCRTCERAWSRNYKTRQSAQVEGNT